MGFKPLKREDFEEKKEEAARRKRDQETGDEQGESSKKQRTPEKAAASALKKRNRGTRDEGESSKKQRTHKGKTNQLMDDAGPRPPPPLPEHFKNAIREMAGGRRFSPAKLVIQKRLCFRDVCELHNCMSIPLKHMENPDFLAEDENEKSRTRKLDVRIVEPHLQISAASFLRWDMTEENGKVSTSYIINGTWKGIVLRNSLRQGMVLQIWAFRIEESLWFALVTMD